LVFNIWSVIIGLFILFRYGFHGFITISYTHHEFCMVTIVDSSQLRVMPFQ
jgi:hypothetical protein